MASPGREIFSGMTGNPVSSVVKGMSRAPHLRHRLASFRCRPLWLGLLLAVAAAGGAAAQGSDPARRSYELAAGDAVTTLRQLSAISGREILFPAEIVRGVRTNPVRGEFTALEAARHLLAGTSLFVTQDERSGALAIHRAKPRRE
jgi:hypothetical protein